MKSSGCHRSRRRFDSNNQAPQRRAKTSGSNTSHQETSLRTYLRYNQNGRSVQIEESNNVEVIPIKNSIVTYKTDNPITARSYDDYKHLRELYPSPTSRLVRSRIEVTMHPQSDYLTLGSVIKERWRKKESNGKHKLSEPKSKRARKMLLVCRTNMLLLVLSLIVTSMEGKSKRLRAFRRI